MKSLHEELGSLLIPIRRLLDQRLSSHWCVNHACYASNQEAGQEDCDFKASQGNVERPCLRMQVEEEEEEIGLTGIRGSQPYKGIGIYFENIPRSKTCFQEVLIN